MEQEKLLVMIQVEVENPEEFNKTWLEEVLTVWEKCGARHLGSPFLAQGGGLVRFLAFKDEAAFAGLRQHMDQTEDGAKVAKVLSAYKFSAKTSLLNIG